MKKISIVILSCLLLSVCLLTGCSTGADGTHGDSSEQTVTVTDHNGDTVTLPKNIERIAVADIFPLASVLSVFFDSASKIIAMPPTSMTAAENGLLSELYPEITNADTSAFSGTDVNAERLMELAPQIVFYNADNASMGQTLKRAGFAAVAVSVSKWNYDAATTLYEWISLLSTVFPAAENDKAASVREYSDRMIQFVSERIENLPPAERKKVFFLFQYSDSTIVTNGKHSFGQQWADKIGCINVAGELEQDGSVKVTAEQVYAWDPDIIFVTNFNAATPQDLYDNAVGSYDWSGIRAVRDRRVYKMPLGMYRSFTPGVDSPIALLWLAKTAYPELFEDIDMIEKTEQYYQTVFGVELTDRQAQSIFAPAAESGKVDF